MMKPANPILQEDVDRILANPLPWERFQGTRVLVTGAAGFLPAYMIETLLGLNDRRGTGCTVVAMVRDPAKALGRFGHHGQRPDLEILQHDAAVPYTAGPSLDFIFHAASAASPQLYLSDPVGTLLPNLIGTHHLLSRAQTDQCQSFLYFSSPEVYGPTPGAIPTAETDYGSPDPLDIRAPYTEGKRGGEALCAAYTRQHGLHTIMLRPFHTYGPGIRLDDGRVFADFVRNIVQRRDLVMKSAGLATRCFTYLSDATAGFFTALLKGQAGTAYNVANEAGEISIAGLADLLVERFADRGLKVQRGEPTTLEKATTSKLQQSSPNVQRLRGLGWSPLVGVADGFERTVRYIEWN
jgi:UDP-glucuronate decarboxylase